MKSRVRSRQSLLFFFSNEAKLLLVSSFQLNLSLGVIFIFSPLSLLISTFFPVDLKLQDIFCSYNHHTHIDTKTGIDLSFSKVP
jgi:hypothetical protein